MFVTGKKIGIESTDLRTAAAQLADELLAQPEILFVKKCCPLAEARSEVLGDPHGYTITCTIHGTCGSVRDVRAK